MLEPEDDDVFKAVDGGGLPETMVTLREEPLEKPPSWPFRRRPENDPFDPVPMARVRTASSEAACKKSSSSSSLWARAPLPANPTLWLSLDDLAFLKHPLGCELPGARNSKDQCWSEPSSPLTKSGGGGWEGVLLPSLDQLKSCDPGCDPAAAATDGFACQICGRVLKAKGSLAKHLRTVHSGDIRPFGCDLCGLKFKTPSNLKAHARSHTGERPLSCQICGKRFGYRTSLSNHVRTHQEVEEAKRFRCPHCGKTFHQKGNLQQHLRTHTGDKPFSCSVCPKKFATSSQLKLHQKGHEGVEGKPWRCQFCPKAFVRKEAWAAHDRRHRGDRPFSCFACGKAFADKGVLKKHLSRHAGEKTFWTRTSNLANGSLDPHVGPEFDHQVTLPVLEEPRLPLPPPGSPPPPRAQVWQVIEEAASSSQILANSGSFLSAGDDVMDKKLGDFRQVIYLGFEDQGTEAGSAAP